MGVKTASFSFYAVLATYDWSTVVPYADDFAGAELCGKCAVAFPLSSCAVSSHLVLTALLEVGRADAWVHSVVPRAAQED